MKTFPLRLSDEQHAQLKEIMKSQPRELSKHQYCIDRIFGYGEITFPGLHGYKETIKEPTQTEEFNEAKLEERDRTRFESHVKTIGDTKYCGLCGYDIKGDIHEHFTTCKYRKLITHAPDPTQTEQDSEICEEPNCYREKLSKRHCVKHQVVEFQPIDPVPVTLDPREDGKPKQTEQKESVKNLVEEFRKNPPRPDKQVTELIKEYERQEKEQPKQCKQKPKKLTKKKTNVNRFHKPNCACPDCK